MATPVAVFAAEWAFMAASADWQSPLVLAWLPLIDACFVTGWTFAVATVLVLAPS